MEAQALEVQPQEGLHAAQQAEDFADVAVSTYQYEVAEELAAVQVVDQVDCPLVTFAASLVEAAAAERELVQLRQPAAYQEQLEGILPAAPQGGLQAGNKTQADQAGYVDEDFSEDGPPGVVPGGMGILVGLKQRAELNGTSVVIGAFYVERQAFAVRLPDGAEAFAEAGFFAGGPHPGRGVWLDRHRGRYPGARGAGRPCRQAG